MSPILIDTPRILQSTVRTTLLSKDTTTMSVCHSCLQITPTTQKHVLHPNIDSLRASAQTCPLCHMIYQKLEQHGHVTAAENYRASVDGKYQVVNDTSVTVSVNGHDATANNMAHQLVFSCGPLKRENSITGQLTKDAPVSWLAVEADENSPAAEVVARRPLTKSSSSERTFGLLKNWIATCVTRHAKCQLGYTH